MSDRFFISQMRRLMRIEAELDRERSFRYQDPLRIARLKKQRLRIKDWLDRWFMAHKHYGLIAIKK